MGCAVSTVNENDSHRLRGVGNSGTFHIEGDTDWGNIAVVGLVVFAVLLVLFFSSILAT